MDAKAYWVALNMVKGIGAVRMQALLDCFGDAQSAWNARASDLRSAGLTERVVQNLVKLRGEVDLALVWERIQKRGIQVITRQDEHYPRRLKEIDQSPPVLYTCGDLTPGDEWAVAIVGTRRVTGYGRAITEELTDYLARNGVTVVSGLARGVDAVAHETALRAGGRTIAVLGSGVDRIYPPEHRPLAERIAGQGAVLSDYSPGTPPESVNFPPRNRIISGLSLATVVIEAGETSGALITARFAAEQGRDVFAIPGPIYASQSKGTNRLIQQGARPLLKVDEVLEELNLQQVQEYRQASLVIPADAVEASLLKLIGPQPVHIDDILAESSLPIEQVSATLTLMELKGLVRQTGGMNYIAVRELPANYRTDENV
jgi:DNA processing protein